MRKFQNLLGSKPGFAYPQHDVACGPAWNEKTSSNPFL